ncbi:MAG: hypothetical protein ACLRX4_06415 [Oscillospiraceae bacterium]
MLPLTEIETLEYKTQTLHCGGCSNRCMLTVTRFPAGGATPPATAARRARGIRTRTKREQTFSPTSASGCSAIRRLRPRLRRAVSSASRVC